MFDFKDIRNREFWLNNENKKMDNIFSSLSQRVIEYSVFYILENDAHFNRKLELINDRMEKAIEANYDDFKEGKPVKFSFNFSNRHSFNDIGSISLTDAFLSFASKNAISIRDYLHSNNYNQITVKDFHTIIKTYYKNTNYLFMLICTSILYKFNVMCKYRGLKFEVKYNGIIKETDEVAFECAVSIIPEVKEPATDY